MSGIVIWFGALSVAAVLAVGTANIGRAAIDQSQASSAADAAALAAAAEGVHAAVKAAELNGATLVSFSENGNIFRVVVQVGDATVEAFGERVLVAIEPG